MANSLGDFEKLTSAGRHFVIRFLDDNTLIEWSSDLSEHEGWPGTWTSGAVKHEFVETTIGIATTHYEPTGYGSITGEEKIDGRSVGSSTITIPTTDLVKLQSY